MKKYIIYLIISIVLISVFYLIPIKAEETSLDHVQIVQDEPFVNIDKLKELVIYSDYKEITGHNCSMCPPKWDERGEECECEPIYEIKGIIYRSHYNKELAVIAYYDKKDISSRLTFRITTHYPESLKTYDQWAKAIETELNWMKNNKVIEFTEEDIKQINDLFLQATSNPSWGPWASFDIAKTNNNWKILIPISISQTEPLNTSLLPENENFYSNDTTSNETFQKEKNYWPIIIISMILVIILAFILVTKKKSF